MSYWVDIKGHPNYKVNCDIIPRMGEAVILGPETFEGQEGNLCYRVVDISHRVEAAYPGFESPLVVLEPLLDEKKNMS